VDVKVRDRLSGGVAVVDPDVVACGWCRWSRSIRARFSSLIMAACSLAVVSKNDPTCRRGSPAYARRHREAVANGEREFALEDETVARQAAEWAVDVHGSLRRSVPVVGSVGFCVARV